MPPGYLLDTNFISETRKIRTNARRSLPVVDTLIAATAITRGLTLVTRNTRDAAATGVLVLDPWRGGER